MELKKEPRAIIKISWLSELIKFHNMGTIVQLNVQKVVI